VRLPEYKPGPVKFKAPEYGWNIYQHRHLEEENNPPVFIIQNQLPTTL
jgi:hypothetical protein